ncbi:helix-turn-helix transcriptional regulator [Actinomadura geliboluensis]|uniref:Helix-turn-helix transcriptional regulator n=1 Tax=Actinomadura geliboluensis TaxID=882440 RepID=A0A5S4H612_9ACTN|nr:helix-turn-helix transcriptional regulator [Actinomadura geliboluensis]TMR40449.1 helix-turn-helix transcriptional regulator [Actinomadura geliboluensis]
MIDQRERRALLDAAARAGDASDLFAAASARLGRLVGFQAAAWSATDPETGLVTAPMRVENLGRGEDCFAYWECALLEETVLPFRELARAAVPAAGLAAGTDGLPARSAQFRKLLDRQGVGDELRAVLRTGGRPWGVVSLFREKGREPFGPAEISLVAGLSAPLADRLRELARPVRTAEPAAAQDPGLILFDAAGTPISINAEARHHLDRLPDGPTVPSPLGPPLPVWLAGTAAQARAVAAGHDRGAARIRIRARDGQWLVVHASCLDGAPGGAPGPTAVVVQPATGSDMAPVIAEAYGLSARELEITQLVARGLATGDIAAELVISPHTVRDHVKAVFAKTGVTSRGELVAKLFAENYWPRRAERRAARPPGR